MIVKVQRAIMPPDAPALIYDRARDVMLQVALGPDLDAAMGSRAKAYFEAEVVDAILERAYFAEANAKAAEGLAGVEREAV